jgi:hypothetical protein
MEKFYRQPYRTFESNILRGLRLRLWLWKARLKALSFFAPQGTLLQSPQTKKQRRQQLYFRVQRPQHKRRKNLQFNLSGLLEAADTAFKVMKNPKDIFSS